MDASRIGTEDLGGVEYGDPGNQAAGTYGVLFLFGAAVLWMSLALPGDPERDEVGLAACGAISFLLGGLLVGRRKSVAPWAIHASVALVVVLIAIIVDLAGPDATGAYAVAFPLIVLPGFYYFALRDAVVYAVFAAAAYGAVLVLDDRIPLRGVRLLTGLAGMAVVALVMVRLRRQTDSLLARLERAARTDPLTGIANRREFDERFALELARAERTGAGFALVIVDLDQFKRVNDEHGHEVGDRVLVRFASQLNRSTRRIDLVARLGGEEFAILAPGAGPEDALIVAERIRVAAAELFRGLGPVTTSGGIATWPENGRDADALLRAADAALYAAKGAGRNRNVIAGAAGH